MLAPKARWPEDLVCADREVPPSESSSCDSDEAAIARFVQMIQISKPLLESVLNPKPYIFLRRGLCQRVLQMTMIWLQSVSKLHFHICELQTKVRLGGPAKVGTPQLLSGNIL